MMDREQAHEQIMMAISVLDQPEANMANNYWVPRFLVDTDQGFEPVNVGSARDFFRRLLERIALEAEPDPRRQQTSALTYQSFIRCFASLNNSIGTALSQIAFLPYLRNRLGVGSIIFLPTSEIGISRRKGERGSPFAVRDPFTLDPSLADPLLPELSAEQQYRTLIAACRLMGINAGSIVPLTTLSIDSPIFRDHPAVGYWWKKPPGSNLFARELKDTRVARALDLGFQKQFVDPPATGDVVEAQTSYGRFWTDQDNKTVLVNALPHPIAGDPETYTWSDVASVRYSAERTPPLQGTLQTRVWDYDLPAFKIMPDILRWRHEHLGENLFLIDVFSSLPREILRRASKPTKGMHFIAEQLWSFEKKGGEVDGVVGPIVFAAGAYWWDKKQCISALARILDELKSSPLSAAFFAGVSNHDTKPAPAEVSPAFWAATWLLPGAVPFVFSGSEFGCTQIVNREFGFSSNEMQEITDDQLALFNDITIQWTDRGELKDLSSQAHRILETRQGMYNQNHHTYRIEQIKSHYLALEYTLEPADRSKKRIKIVFNLDDTTLKLPDSNTVESVNVYGGTALRYGADFDWKVPAQSTAVVVLS